MKIASRLIDLGCVRLGNLDLDFENPDFGFAIEREIQKTNVHVQHAFLSFSCRCFARLQRCFVRLKLQTS